METQVLHISPVRGAGKLHIQISQATEGRKTAIFASQGNPQDAVDPAPPVHPHRPHGTRRRAAPRRVPAPLGAAAQRLGVRHSGRA
ncbi:hypothetical protein CDO44_27105 [Pigmentiphaga sp. NML080357]|nr:hypothetical protein CDO44_27105 [Pigmentiphaga sp. NML080357]